MVESDAPENRYAGRPFLRLVDCYVLDVIGQLDSAQKQTLEQMTPRFKKTFSSSLGTWQEIVEEQLDLKPQARDSISKFWAGFTEHQERHGQDASAFEFVRQFTAQNFPSVVYDVQ